MIFFCIRVLVQHRKALWEMATGECKSHPQILHTTHLWRIVAWYGGSGDYCCGIFSGHFLHTISFQCLHPAFSMCEPGNEAEAIIVLQLRSMTSSKFLLHMRSDATFLEVLPFLWVCLYKNVSINNFPLALPTSVSFIFIRLVSGYE